MLMINVPNDSFTAREILFWAKFVIQMVNNAGWESDKAIDEIRAHYGTNLSVTSTMKNEKR